MKYQGVLIRTGNQSPMPITMDVVNGLTAEDFVQGQLDGEFSKNPIDCGPIGILYTLKQPSSPQRNPVASELLRKFCNKLPSDFINSIVGRAFLLAPSAPPSKDFIKGQIPPKPFSKTKEAALDAYSTVFGVNVTNTTKKPRLTPKPPKKGVAFYQDERWAQYRKEWDVKASDVWSSMSEAERAQWNKDYGKTTKFESWYWNQQLKKQWKTEATATWQAMSSSEQQEWSAKHPSLDYSVWFAAEKAKKNSMSIRQGYAKEYKETLTEEQKRRYEDMAAKDHERYEREYAEYLAKNPKAPRGPVRAHQYFKKSGQVGVWSELSEEVKKPFLEQAAKDMKRWEEEYNAFRGRCSSLGIPLPKRKRNLAKVSENDDAESSDASAPKEKKVKPAKAEKKKRDANASDSSEPKPKKVKKPSSEPSIKQQKRAAEESDEAPKKKKPRKAKVPGGDGAKVTTKNEDGEAPSDVPVSTVQKRKKAEGEAKPVAVHA